MGKVTVILGYWLFVLATSYIPGLSITPQNPTLIRMPTSSSTVSFRVPVFAQILSIDTLFTGTLPMVPLPAHMLLSQPRIMALPDRHCQPIH